MSAQNGPQDPQKPVQPKKKRGGHTKGSEMMQDPGLAREYGTARLEKLTLTAEQAFKDFVGLGTKGTVDKLHSIYQQAGTKCSRSTLAKWSSRDNWLKRREHAVLGADPAKVSDQLITLAEIAKTASMTAIDGLIGKSMANLNMAFDCVKVVSPQDVAIMIKNLESLIKVKTSYRSAMHQAAMIDQATFGADTDAKEDKIVGIRPVSNDDDVPSIGAFRRNIIEGGDPNPKKPA